MGRTLVRRFLLLVYRYWMPKMSSCCSTNLIISAKRRHFQPWKQSREGQKQQSNTFLLFSSKPADALIHPCSPVPHVFPQDLLCFLDHPADDSRLRCLCFLFFWIHDVKTLFQCFRCISSSSGNTTSKNKHTQFLGEKSPREHVKMYHDST